MNDLPLTIRDLLACPRCQGPLTDAATASQASGGTTELQCQACAVVFPVEEGIPVLLLERARPLG